MKHTNISIVEAFLKGDRTGQACNQFIEGDSLYSFGRHYELARCIRGAYLVNDDGYSATTEHHISKARSILGRSMCRKLVTAPFKLLKQAFHSLDDIEVVDTASDRNALLLNKVTGKQYLLDTFQHLNSTQFLVELAAKEEPYKSYYEAFDGFWGVDDKDTPIVMGDWWLYKTEHTVDKLDNFICYEGAPFVKERENGRKAVLEVDDVHFVVGDELGVPYVSGKITHREGNWRMPRFKGASKAVFKLVPNPVVACIFYR